MEDFLNFKTVYVKTLNKINFNSTINIPIENNTNIKKILDINSYLFDTKVECGNEKAIISGRIGIKIVYLDSENTAGTIFENQPFTETFQDSSITTETYLNISNCNILNNVLSTEGILKISCEVNISPISYINLTFSNNVQSNEFLVSKKDQIVANNISTHVQTSFYHTTNFETMDKVSKILICNNYFNPEKTIVENGYISVEGKMKTTLLIEVLNEDSVTYKELYEINKIKYDVEINSLNKDDLVDLTYCVNKGFEEISTEVDNETNIITIKSNILVNGVVLNKSPIEIVNDLFSTQNQIETIISKREYIKNTNQFSVSETILNEITLSTDETAIDEVIANLNINPETTNSYVKNGSVFIEGIVNSNLTYIDENKEIKQKNLEVPFVINTKVTAKVDDCVHSQISIIDARIKIKRGTIIELEYSAYITLSVYEKESCEILDSYTLGKSLDNSKYDFQIYIAKPNETIWELCKRTKISPTDIYKFNNSLPDIMVGGEKIIVKR